MIGNAVAVVQSCPDRPWLILGKGPTLDWLHRVDYRDLNLLTLNHACRVVDPHLAHFIDLEAFLDCTPRCNVVLPWVPNFRMRAHTRTLRELADDRRSALCTAEGEGRLWSYNSLQHAHTPRHPGLPAIRVRYFSAVAAVNLLAEAGVREILTLGVDGGRSYAQGFDPKDRLANGRPSFDVQFQEIRKTVHERGVRYHDLGAWFRKHSPSTRNG